MCALAKLTELEPSEGGVDALEPGPLWPQGVQAEAQKPLVKDGDPAG